MLKASAHRMPNGPTVVDPETVTSVTAIELVTIVPRIKDTSIAANNFPIDITGQQEYDKRM